MLTGCSAAPCPLQVLLEEAEEEGRPVLEPPAEARLWCAARRGRARSCAAAAAAALPAA